MGAGRGEKEVGKEWNSRSPFIKNKDAEKNIIDGIKCIGKNK